MQRGDLHRAVEAARQATGLDPDDLDAWWLLGSATCELWIFGEAEEAFAQGIKRAPSGSPRQVSFLVHRARALAAMARMASAKNLIEKALAIGTHDPAHLAIMGKVLTQAGCTGQAIPLLESAVKAAPDNAENWHLLAEAQQYIGDLDAAETAYEHAIDLASLPAAHLALARLRRWTKAHHHIARLQRLPRRNAQEAASICYALFKECDDIGDHEAAWNWLQMAALAAQDQVVPAERGQWNRGQPLLPPVRIGDWKPAQEAAIVDSWIEHFPASRFENPPASAPQRPRRIFIIGLPRSGTTLVERILTAHSQVQAQGELQVMALGTKILSASRSGPMLDPDVAARAARIDPVELAEYYRSETVFLSDGSPYAIDKLPHNYHYAGLIRLAFPDAIIIHLRRDPMDSLFGTYRLLFGYAYRWSYTQDNLAGFYAQYVRLTRHWRACFAASGQPLIDVSLEALIASPESEIRRLLAACGLPFEAACLNPHKSDGAVATASSVQVRRPINSEGVGAWRRYAAGLAPLRQRLFEMGFIDEDGLGRA